MQFNSVIDSKINCFMSVIIVSYDRYLDNLLDPEINKTGHDENNLETQFPINSLRHN